MHEGRAKNREEEQEKVPLMTLLLSPATRTGPHNTEALPSQTKKTNDFMRESAWCPRGCRGLVC
jgi:hypothetical protein